MGEGEEVSGSSAIDAAAMAAMSEAAPGMLMAEESSRDKEGPRSSIVTKGENLRCSGV